MVSDSAAISARPQPPMAQHHGARAQLTVLTEAEPTQTKKRSTRQMVALNPEVHTPYVRSATSMARPKSRAEYDEQGRCKAVSGVIYEFVSPDAR